MRMLVIGGTGFIGRFLVPELQRRGHDVAVFHRGNTPPAGDVPSVAGDRHRLAEHAAALRAFAPEIVIDLILGSGVQGTALVDVFRGVASRLVVSSSIDVYRACGVLHGTEPGPLEPLPLTEDSPLRSGPAYPPAAVERLLTVVPWLDREYDKVAAERAVQDEPSLPATVLRLPILYGPGDPLHRLHPVVKRAADGRRAMLFDERSAQWRGPRGYVENIAQAIALAAASPAAEGRTYNVAEQECLPEREWTRLVASAARWRGELIVLPDERMPPHLRRPGNLDQHWVVDSSRIRAELRYEERVARDEALRRTVAWERAEAWMGYDPAAFDYAAEDEAIVTPE